MCCEIDRIALAANPQVPFHYNPSLSHKYKPSGVTGGTKRARSNEPLDHNNESTQSQSSSTSSKMDEKEDVDEAVIHSHFSFLQVLLE